jgi:branched-chain amino acid transport system substrate-binding protein
VLGKVIGRLQWTVLGAVAAACHNPPQDIRIGVLVEATGPRRETSGLSTLQAARLAEQQANASGGILVGGIPHRVRIILRDIGDQADLATSQARDLLNRDSVVALVGPQFSRDAIPVASLAQQAQVPMISPMSTHPQTTSGKPYVFRIAFTDDLQGRALARFARETLHARRAALLYDVALDYSRNLSEVFRAEFIARGGTVVADQQFTSDRAVDFTAQLTRIRAAHPDVIFSPNFTSADSLQVIQARRLGLESVFVGSDSWNLESLHAVPEVEGAYYAVQWRADIATVEADSFVVRYRQEYGSTPDATAAATWDAFQIIFAAIRRAGSLAPDSIRRAIAATEGFRGITGVVTYRNGGDPPKSVYIMRFVNGRGVFQQRVDP